MYKMGVSSPKQNRQPPASPEITVKPSCKALPYVLQPLPWGGQKGHCRSCTPDTAAPVLQCHGYFVIVAVLITKEINRLHVFFLNIVRTNQRKFKSPQPQIPKKPNWPSAGSPMVFSVLFVRCLLFSVCDYLEPLWNAHTYPIQQFENDHGQFLMSPSSFQLHLLLYYANQYDRATTTEIQVWKEKKSIPENCI